MTSPLGKLGPQGAPRGLLVYWLLRRISQSPTYGFEVLKEIEARTEGAWRPGPGSVYPLLKKMVDLGYVESEKVKGARADQHLYKITKMGTRQLEEKREMFRTVGTRLNGLRGIFSDLIEPEGVADFVVPGSRKQFELVRQIVDLNRDRIPEPELRSMLKEYTLLLESQKGWVARGLHEAPVARRRHSLE